MSKTNKKSKSKESKYESQTDESCCLTPLILGTAHWACKVLTVLFDWSGNFEVVDKDYIKSKRK